VGEPRIIVGSDVIVTTMTMLMPTREPRIELHLCFGSFQDKNHVKAFAQSLLGNFQVRPVETEGEIIKTVVILVGLLLLLLLLRMVATLILIFLVVLLVFTESIEECRVIVWFVVIHILHRDMFCVEDLSVLELPPFDALLANLPPRHSPATVVGWHGGRFGLDQGIASFLVPHQVQSRPFPGIVLVLVPVIAFVFPPFFVVVSGVVVSRSARTVEAEKKSSIRSDRMDLESP